MRFSKKFFTLLLTVVLLLVAVQVSANTPITVVVDGQVVAFTDQQPMNEGGTILVPVRGVFELMGFTPAWEPSTSTATLTSEDAVIAITVGESTFTVNGETFVAEPLPARLVEGRVLLPLRAVAEALGATPEWNGATQTAYIQTKSAEAPPVTPELPAAVGTLIPSIEVEFVVFEYGRAIEGITMILTDVYDRITDDKLIQVFYFAPTGTVTFNRDIPILVTESVEERPFGYSYKHVHYRTFYAGVEYPILEFKYEAEWGTDWHSVRVFDLTILDEVAANHRLYDTDPNIGPFIAFTQFIVADDEDLEWLYDTEFYVPLTDLVNWRVPIFINVSTIFEQRPEVMNAEQVARQQEMLAGLVLALYQGDVRVDVQEVNISMMRNAIPFRSTEDVADTLTVRIVENPNWLLAEVVERLDFNDFEALSEWSDAVAAQRYNRDNMQDTTVFYFSEFNNEPGGRWFDIIIFFAPN